jgi:hypothetical protein
MMELPFRSLHCSALSACATADQVCFLRPNLFLAIPHLFPVSLPRRLAAMADALSRFDVAKTTKY